jgi:hypothetical protein
MQKIIIASLLFFGQSATFAQAIEAPAIVGLHIATIHSTSGWCDANPGLYARWSGGFTAGAYRNSECHPSAYLGWSWQTQGRVRAGVMAGAVVGYSARPVLLLLLPSLSFDLTPSTAARLTYVPKVEKRGAHALHFSLEFPI